MARNTYILFITIIVAFLLTAPTLYAADSDPLPIGVENIQVKEKASSLADSHLSLNKQTIGADLRYNTVSSPLKGYTTTSAMLEAWGDPFADQDQWQIGHTGNVGYPIGDISYPILISMLLLYFAYRGISSTKRKNNF